MKKEPMKPYPSWAIILPALCLTVVIAFFAIQGSVAVYRGGSGNSAFSLSRSASPYLYYTTIVMLVMIDSIALSYGFALWKRNRKKKANDEMLKNYKKGSIFSDEA